MTSHDSFKIKAKSVLDFLLQWEVLGVRYHQKEEAFDTDSVQDTLVDNITRALDSLEDDVDGMFIVIDEADRPNETARFGEFLKMFTERLAKNNCRRVLFGLAGLPNTIQKLKSSHESSARLFEIITLQPLSRNWSPGWQ